MIKRGFRGQEATEFVLISILVFFSALLVVFLFGGKISKFFTNDSSAVRVAKGASSAINPGGQQKYDTEIDNYTGATKTTSGSSSFTPADITMPDVTENADGSLSFSVAGRNVTLSSQLKAQNNTVFQTTGSSGSLELIKEIAYMIEKHKAEYTDGNVPIEISYGLGDREGNGSAGGSYEGTAKYNSITIKSGNDIIILQKDQTCSYNSGGCCDYHTDLMGTYRIEGTVNPSTQQFDAQVTSSSKIELAGSYNGKLITNSVASWPLMCLIFVILTSLYKLVPLVKSRFHLYVLAQ